MKKVLFAVLCLLAVCGCSKEDGFSDYSRKELKFIKIVNNKSFVYDNYDSQITNRISSTYSFFCFKKPISVKYFINETDFETITLHGGIILYYINRHIDNKYYLCYFNINHQSSNLYRLNRFFVNDIDIKSVYNSLEEIGRFPYPVNQELHDSKVDNIDVAISDTLSIEINNKKFYNEYY